MGGFSLWHWLVVIILILLLFGRGRISDMMGDIAKGLKSFKKGMAEDEDSAKPAGAAALARASSGRSTSRPSRAAGRDPQPAPPADDTTPRR